MNGTLTRQPSTNISLGGGSAPALLVLMAEKKVAGKTRGGVYPKGASKLRHIQIAEYPADCTEEVADRVYAEDALSLANPVVSMDFIFTKPADPIPVVHGNGAALVNEKALVAKTVRGVQIKFRKRQSGLSAALTKAFHAGKLRALAANR